MDQCRRCEAEFIEMTPFGSSSAARSLYCLASKLTNPLEPPLLMSSCSLTERFQENSSPQPYFKADNVRQSCLQ
jgi:hypothetical protein